MQLPQDLRTALAAQGFESHEDYAYPLRCLLEQDGRVLRCLAIEGDCGRRKTAFATALAAAMQLPHTLYLDLSSPPPPPPPLEVESDDDGPTRPLKPLNPLERTLSDACAYSEAEATICILDQLQALDFAEQIRLYRFLQGGRWQAGDGEYEANPRKLLLFLISEVPLYHALQKRSFRLWVKRAGYAEYRYRAQEFGLGDDAQAVIDALDPVFAALEVLPTHSEYARLLDDIHARVGDADDLARSIYGWTEGVRRERLESSECRALLGEAMGAVYSYIAAEVVELSGGE